MLSQTKWPLTLPWFAYCSAELLLLFFNFWCWNITCLWSSGPRGTRRWVQLQYHPSSGRNINNIGPGERAPSGPGTAEGTDHWLHKSIIPHVKQQQPTGLWKHCKVWSPLITSSLPQCSSLQGICVSITTVKQPLIKCLKWETTLILIILSQLQTLWCSVFIVNTAADSFLSRWKSNNK